MFLLIVPGLVLLTWWVLVPAVVVVEDSKPVASLGRSKELVRGYGWEVFGIIVLTFVLQIVVGFLLGLVLAPLDDAVAALISNLVSGIAIGPVRRRDVDAPLLPHGRGEERHRARDGTATDRLGLYRHVLHVEVFEDALAAPLAPEP